MTSISLATLRHLLNAAEEVAESYMPCCEETPDGLDDAIIEARDALQMATTRLASTTMIDIG